MKFLHSLFIALALVLIAPSCLSADANAPATQVPFQLAPGLFNHQQADLGLTEPAGISHSLVNSAAESGYHYNHGAVLFAFKDRLYVQWQSSREDEDAADTQVKYAWSSDGIHWSQAQTLASSSANELVTNGGWWTYQHRLIALLNHWPYNNSPKQGYVTYSSSLDASHWTPEQPLRDAQAQPLGFPIRRPST